MSEQLYKPGSIVLVHFPFAEFTESKLRPAIIINTDLPDSLLVLFITSQQTFSTSYDVPLQPSETNGLKAPSIVRANRLTVIAVDHLARTIGTLATTEHGEVKAALRKLSSDF